jgi:ATP-dependent Lhr-like helicase
VERLFPDARFEPQTGLPALPVEEREPEEIAAEVVRGHLDILGPCSMAQLCEATSLSADLVEIALARLEHQGFALRGDFVAPPNAEPASTQFCSRRLLSRMHHYTLERLRREIEPVSARDLMRFLLRWQHVAPSSEWQGERAVQSAVEQLQGFELAAAAWEEAILPARIRGYTRQALDSACLSGEVCWARLGGRAREAESDYVAPQAPSRATPITLALRADFAWLMQAARGDKVLAAPSSPLTRRVLSTLETRGASFFSDLVQASGLDAGEVAEGLWDAVACGLVSADGFQPLRSLLTGRGFALQAQQGRTGLRRGRAGASTGDGRWSLVKAATTTADRDELAEAVAEQLLARWGVVFRDLLVRETLSVPWRDIVWALRRLEARGTIRGGRFVTGFVGEQFALPEAVDQLRSTRRLALSGETVRLSAVDPLNLIGIIVPGARVPALRTQHIVYRDGMPLTVDSSDALSATPDARPSPALLSGVFG